MRVTAERVAAAAAVDMVMAAIFLLFMFVCVNGEERSVNMRASGDRFAAEIIKKRKGQIISGNGRLHIVNEVDRIVVDRTNSSLLVWF